VSFALAVIGLALLVLLHEAGHFFVALATRMRPRRFYVGFPPALAKVKRKGIEYGIGAIPLGGYVKIPGMFRPGKRDPEIYFRAAAEEDKSLSVSVEALGSSLEQGDLERANPSKRSEARSSRAISSARKRISSPCAKSSRRPAFHRARLVSRGAGSRRSTTG